MKNCVSTSVLIAFYGLLLFLGGPGFLSARGSPDLVPATVEDNEMLPSRTIVVKGVPSEIHYRELGDPTAPAVFIMHGSLSDMRAYLPLAEEISRRYHVLLWDQRGNGLSQRVPPEQLGVDWMVAEIEAFRRASVGTETAPVIIGHSWSAAFASLYAGAYPERLSGLILLEPPGLKGEYQNAVGGALNLMSPGYLEMTYLSESIGPGDHDRIDFRALATLTSGVRDFFVDPDNPPPWPVWRVGGVAIGVWESSVAGFGGFHHDFTDNLDRFTGPVLIVGSDHSPIGYEFQREYNSREFPDVTVRELRDSGHRMLTEQLPALISMVNEFLTEVYGE